MNHSDPERQSEEAEAADKFILSMDKFAPTIPDELIEYYLQKTGFSCPDVRVNRIIGLAAQKFVSEVINDSLQFCKMRMANPALKSRGKDKKLVLTMEDLSTALREYGINVRKPEYFADKEGQLLRDGHPLLKPAGRERAEKDKSAATDSAAAGDAPKEPAAPSAPAAAAPATPAPAASGTKRKADATPAPASTPAATPSSAPRKQAKKGE